jgi:hypothetical protein
MPQRLRSSEKPECISLAALRAQARIVASTGQTAGWRSARYSTIASESQTTVLPSCKDGTRPFGENLRNALQFEPGANCMSRSLNGIACTRMSNHGRSDQEE